MVNLGGQLQREFRELVAGTQQRPVPKRRRFRSEAHTRGLITSACAKKGRITRNQCGAVTVKEESPGRSCGALSIRAPDCRAGTATDTFLRRCFEVGAHDRTSHTRLGKLDNIRGAVRHADAPHEPEMVANDPVSLTLARLEEGLRDDGKEFHDMLPNQAERHHGPGSPNWSQRRYVRFKKNQRQRRKKWHSLAAETAAILGATDKFGPTKKPARLSFQGPGA
jgi:hypothetical protein